jgi:hypothetical protein
VGKIIVGFAAIARTSADSSLLPTIADNASHCRSGSRKDLLLGGILDKKNWNIRESASDRDK